MERIPQKDAPAGLMKVLYQVQDYVNNSGIDYTLQELIKVRVSQINGCAFCLDMHFKDAIHAGETPQRLMGLSAWREGPFYTAKEKAVLEFAEFLTELPAETNAQIFYDKLSEFFSMEEIANITLAIVQINTWNRIVRSFGTTAGTYQVGMYKRVAS